MLNYLKSVVAVYSGNAHEIHKNRSLFWIYTFSAFPNFLLYWERGSVQTFETTII